MSIIEIEDLAFGYPRKKILWHIEKLHIEKEDFIIIIGPNASGKSTLCKVLAGILEPLEKPKSFKLPPAPPILVWQRQELFPLSVEGNLRIVCKDVNRVKELINKFSLEGKKKASELSGGQECRLALARALAVEDREVMIFDEPTQSIDPSFFDVIVSVMLQVAESKTTVILVTHDDRLVYQFAHRNPKVFTLESYRTDGTRLSELNGPFKLNTLFQNPPTLFVAEFARYENIFRIINPRYPISLRNLAHPRGQDNDKLVIVKCALSSVTDGSQIEEFKLRKISEELRSGGTKVARYRWEPGAGSKPLDFVISCETAVCPPGEAYITIDTGKCIEIGQ